MDMNNMIDLESAKERFMENETLYKRFLFEFPERTLYAELKEFLKEGKAEEAFQTAHKMKGIIENLSLRMLGEKISAVVEILRKGELPGKELESELDCIYKQCVKEISNIKENNISLF